MGRSKLKLKTTKQDKAQPPTTNPNPNRKTPSTRHTPAPTSNSKRELQLRLCRRHMPPPHLRRSPCIFRSANREAHSPPKWLVDADVGWPCSCSSVQKNRVTVGSAFDHHGHGYCSSASSSSSQVLVRTDTDTRSVIMEQVAGCRLQVAGCRLQVVLTSQREQIRTPKVVRVHCRRHSP